MKYKLYAIYDTIEKQGKPVFNMINDETAMRFQRERIEGLKKAGYTINPEEEKIMVIGEYETDIKINKDLDGRPWPDNPIKLYEQPYFIGLEEPGRRPDEEEII